MYPTKPGLLIHIKGGTAPPLVTPPRSAFQRAGGMWLPANKKDRAKAVPVVSGFDFVSVPVDATAVSW
jgi:hypothetical protein